MTWNGYMSNRDHSKKLKTITEEIFLSFPKFDVPLDVHTDKTN